MSLSHISERVLVVAAHPDDEILMAGATLALYAERGASVHHLFVADGETGRPGGAAMKEARRTAARLAARTIGAKDPHFLDFADQRLDAVPLLDLARAIEAASAPIAPTVVITHTRADLNRDHRVVFEAAATAFRPLPETPWRLFLCGEVASSTEVGGLFGFPTFRPSRFVAAARTWDSKLGALAHYGSEMRPLPHPRSLESISSLARLRGCSAGLDMAEAFEIIFDRRE